MREISLLLQQDRRSGHQGDSPPVPDHDDEDAGGEEGLHGKPDLGEATVLVDSLEKKSSSWSHVQGLDVIIRSRGRFPHHQPDVFDLADAHVHLLALVNGQPDIHQVVLVGHRADLHEGEEVTFVVAALVLYRLGTKRISY